MAYVCFNPNPKGQRVGDCAVRAVSKAIGKNWTDTYIGLCSEGLAFRDMPSSNYVWAMFLKKYGFEEHMIPSVKEVTIDRYGDSEFFQAIEGKKSEEGWMLMDELMQTIQMLHPKLYQATMDKLQGM